jgi:tetratricopeptide (TPR) repeat protein
MRIYSTLLVLFFFSLVSCKTGQKALAAGKSPVHASKKKGQQPLQTKLDKATREKFDRLFLDAEKAKAIEDLDNAITTYKQLLQIDPYNADVYFQIAQIYSGQNKLSDAEQNAVVAINLDKTNKWYLELLANIYMNEGKAKEAVEIYKVLIDKFPGNPDYYLSLGFLYSKTNQFDNAIKVYDQFEKNFGVDENVIQEKKNLYLHLNRFNDAVNEVHKLVDAFPGETEYMLMEAELYRANKMNPQAVDIYKKVLVIEPDNAQALLGMAEVGPQSGDKQSSMDDLKKIFNNPNVDIDTKVKILYPYLQFWDVKKDHKQDAFDLAEILTKVHPGEAKAFAIKADLYYLDNQNDKALEAYLKALDLNKNVFQVWQQVMLIYNLKKDWGNLESTCEKALEYFPNQAVVYLFKGGAEMQNKEYDKAVKSFSHGEKMSADNDKLDAQFYADLGEAYHDQNKNEESDSAFEKALKLDADNANVLNNYSYFLSVRKLNLERAKEMSAYSNKLEPDNSNYLDTYAWILFQLEDYKGAKEWQEKAIKSKDGQSSTIQEHYGDILFKLGDKDGAIENWKKAKELGSDSGTIDKKIAQEKYIE